ncbi:MAG TPA: hypothetical protein DEO85_03140 [Maritimibacter sp.]|nr:hypothetical protein [Maritimibacter sp.]
MRYEPTRPLDLTDALFQAHLMSIRLKRQLGGLILPPSTSELVHIRIRQVTALLDEPDKEVSVLQTHLDALSHDIEMEVDAQTTSVFVCDEYHIDGGVMLGCRTKFAGELEECLRCIAGLLEAIMDLEAMRRAECWS